MKIIKTNIEDVRIFQSSVFSDDRGYFVETFREEIIGKEVGTRFIQENESFSKKGVIRGLHYQKSPHAQAKLVRCVAGEIFDVAVDLRKDSVTFGQHFAIRLSGEDKKQLFIPKGFAHGFAVLSDWAILNYKVDAYYHKEAEITIKYDDVTLNIDWEIRKEDIIISEKDLLGITFEEACFFEC